MEKTFAGMVSEVEKVVKPLGFRIDEAERKDVSPLVGGGSRKDEGVLKITIVHIGKVG